jgi:hypothetical protein
VPVPCHVVASGRTYLSLNTRVVAHFEKQSIIIIIIIIIIHFYLFSSSCSFCFLTCNETISVNSYTYIFLFFHRPSTDAVFFFGQIQTGVCFCCLELLLQLLTPMNLSAYKENLQPFDTKEFFSRCGILL